MKLRLALIAFMVLFLFPLAVHSQDSITVLILSDRVGAVIDANERMAFELFPYIEDFSSAAIIRFNGSDYIFVKRTHLSDTLLVYNPALIAMMGEKIDNYEAIMEGGYKIRLRLDRAFATLPLTEELRGDVLRLLHGASQPARAANQHAVVPEPSSRRLNKNRSQGDDFFSPKGIVKEPELPFSRNVPLVPLRPKEKKLAFGISFSSFYPLDVSDLDKFFTAVEAKYRAQGYNIGSHSRTFGVSLLFSLYAALRFTTNWELLLRSDLSMTGQSYSATGESYSAISALLIFRSSLFRSPWFEWYAGVGIGKYSLTVDQNYGNARISPVAGNGTYTFLESVKVQTGSIGMPLHAGIILTTSSIVSFDLFGSYHYIPVQRMTYNGVSGSVNISNIQFGGRMFVWF